MTPIPREQLQAIGTEVQARTLTDDESAWLLAMICSPDLHNYDDYPDDLDKRRAA